uniref:Hexosyltransferase n=1 Tax=Panagrolaimus davidi TaxID=227884 RepID=A0A914PWS4_9BILA
MEFGENDENEKFKMEFKNFDISYHFLKDEKLNCNETKLLIVIPSRPNAFHTRMAIRKSWLKNVASTITYRFIIGSTPNLTIEKLNHEEFEQYNDLIISNIQDSYLNLTLKTNSILQWQKRYCPKTEYLLKTDDDTVVDVNRLLYWIENDYKNITQNFENKVIFGKIWSKTLPKRDPSKKWYTSYSAWNRKFFPDYCNGPTYLLTAKAVEAILEKTTNFELISIEDVFFTGILAEAAGIKRIDRWKNFGRGKTISTKDYGCNERNVPYLTSIYEIKSDIYEEGKSNAFSDATEKLLALKCLK